MPTPPVAALAATVRARPPVGRVRLVTLDGRSGAGKTRLAGELATALGGAPVLHLDDLYPGWDGLAAAPPRAAKWIAAPLVAGRAARWRGWDWAADASGTWRETPWAPIVLLEGCGAGTAPLRPYTSTALWADAPARVRARRLRTRADWSEYAPHHTRWTAQEDALYAADGTPGHADVVVRTG